MSTLPRTRNHTTPRPLLFQHTHSFRNHLFWTHECFHGIFADSKRSGVAKIARAIGAYVRSNGMTIKSVTPLPSDIHTQQQPQSTLI